MPTESLRCHDASAQRTDSECVMFEKSELLDNSAPTPCDAGALGQMVSERSSQQLIREITRMTVVAVQVQSLA